VQVITSRRQESTSTTAIDLFAAIPGFNRLPRAKLVEAAAAFKEYLAAPGEVVVREGERGDRVFVIASGSAEVSIARELGPRLLSVLGAGDSFGTFALFHADGNCTATVTAQDELHLFGLDAARVRRLIESEPDAAEALRTHAAELLTTNFLTRVGPFGQLDAEARRRLAKRVRVRREPAGVEVVRQGESGDSCFIIRGGRVTVSALRDGAVRELAVLGPGDVFGEAALLTACPRTATVTALESCELLEFDRAALSEIFGQQKAAAAFVRLMRLREHPRRRPGIQVFDQTDSAGEKISILKDPVRLRYFRISERGRFVWDRLDGRSNLRELTFEYFRTFKEFAPHAIAELIATLASAGFVEVAPVLVPMGEDSPRLLDGWAALARRSIEWRFTIRGIDGVLAAFYRRGVRHLYTRAGMAAMLFCAVTGVSCFVAVMFRGASQAHSAVSIAVPVLLGRLASGLVHEAGHAFTTKHFGRTVSGAGVGWYWFSPIAFIDTSEMWLAGRWQRMAVTAAGPCADLVGGAVPSILALAFPPGNVSAALWLFSAPFYLSFLLNLDPLLEYDGYYLAADYLDRPNFRLDSLATLRRLLPRIIPHPVEARGHVVELVYGAAALLYIAIVAVVTLTVSRVALAKWIESVASKQAASALSYAAAGAVVLLASLSVIAELRTASRHSEYGVVAARRPAPGASNS
jgi:putative peptide zinc metalloprotease protein